MKNRFCRAFTLIELLVVISIIAVLMSIMMPALRKAREQAQTTICKSQLKQFSLALALYAEDNNGKFLTHEWGTTGTPKLDGYWFARIGPYFDTDKKGPYTNKLMRCPSGQSIKDYGDELIYGWPGTDYGLQQAEGNNKAITQILQPDKFATFFDFYHGEKARGSNFATSGSIRSGTWYEVIREHREAEFFRTRVYRHYSKKGINILYADSHISNAVAPDWWEHLASPSSIGWNNKK